MKIVSTAPMANKFNGRTSANIRLLCKMEDREKCIFQTFKTRKLLFHNRHFPGLVFFVGKHNVKMLKKGQLFLSQEKDLMNHAPAWGYSNLPQGPVWLLGHLQGCDKKGGAGVQGARLGAGAGILSFPPTPPVPFLLRCRISFASFNVTPAGATTSSFRGVITCGARNISLQVGR